MSDGSGAYRETKGYGPEHYDRYPKDDLPEFVVSRMPGLPSKITQDRTQKNNSQPFPG